MRIKILLMAVVLAGLLFSLSASAQDCVNPITTDPSCDSIPFDRQLSYEDTIVVDKFDQSLGELLEVRVTAQACGHVTAELDSEDQTAQQFTIIAFARVIPHLPNEGEETLEIGFEETFDVSADDEPGEADYAGSDYSGLLFVGSEADPVCTVEREFIYTGAQMDPFIGDAGDELSIPVSTVSGITVLGSVSQDSRSNAFMGIEICVEYVYCEPDDLCINGTKIDACTNEGLADWTILLKDAAGAVIDTTTTDENGDYSFCILPPGNYVVCELEKAGWKPVGPICRDVTLVDANEEGVNFENEPAFCISGFKFNGTTDEGLAGWTIQLKDAAGTVIGTTTTGADGSYEFCGLFSGSYTVCEVTQSGWTPIGPTCISVTLDCEDSEDNIFRNTPAKTPSCGSGCPWFIKNELYTANCKELLVVGADKGILANEMSDDVVVLDPESITIDPKYGTITVEEDGSFVYNPIGATGIRNGVYVIFKYAANNGLCDARYLGIAKIQVAC